MEKVRVAPALTKGSRVVIELLMGLYVLHPFYVWLLWRYWWLRPMIQQSFRTFMQKRCLADMPNHTTLRKTYLKKLFEETIHRIRCSIGDDRIWISIDETTDIEGQFVVNTIISVLNPDTPSVPFLLYSDIAERTNHISVAEAFTDSLNLLWPDGVHHGRILLFVTDGASYMKSAAQCLRVLFPKMIHVTCVVHGLHRLCEEIRVLFPQVDNLIAHMKKVSLKSTSRNQTLRTIAPTVPQPSRPIITRWGTWIVAALYYAEHFGALHQIVDELDSSEAAAIAKSQELFRYSGVIANLAFIAANLSEFP
ncbi:uncharacterized protein LOC108864709 [Galendromus occidentalis]|uniref:Uncharacterized protein LOC108864709 n=1 Tax=Galendromus occidentalis TaxID=34638 RepID=A0AAJ7L7P8_9ACAR|nr:uncharacterized protein LOC108864709 [Galendromus occidentalis]